MQAKARPKWLIPLLACGGLFLLLIAVGAIGAATQKKKVALSTATSTTHDPATTQPPRTTTTKPKPTTTTAPKPTTTTVPPTTSLDLQNHTLAQCAQYYAGDQSDLGLCNLTASDAPTTTQPPPIQNVVFRCSGSAPAGIDITYGAEGSNIGAARLPLAVTVPYNSGAQYYAVTAQLQGAGSVTCTTTVNWNDGQNETVTQTGTAAGGYNIASAEVCSEYDGSWQDC